MRFFKQLRIILPQELSKTGIQETIRDFAACAANAKEAGYDGVEVPLCDYYSNMNSGNGL